MILDLEDSEVGGAKDPVNIDRMRDPLREKVLSEATIK
jgi:hypothetical protein